MIFNTWTFAAFAVVVLTIYWTLIPPAWKPVYIIITGTIFYAFSVPAYLLLITSLAVVTYVTGRAILLPNVTPLQRKLLMTAGVVIITGILVFFKYTKFLALTVAQVAGHNVIPIPQIIVPLAISFFTFEFVHVLVDIYLGKIRELNPLDFAVFTMFFPTLVAGPIKRYQSFAPQLHDIELPPREVVALNIYRVFIGLAKKFIIADSMTTLAQALTAPTLLPYGRLDYVVAILAYTAKIYFDFTGYSDIAIGTAGLLGLRIPENFDRPYFAQNISEFWRRWHMSLSSWIRDYIFIPLGGSRRPPLITALNLLLAMALAGLWHGAAWTFVVWGLWQGIGLAVHRVWSQTVATKLAWMKGNMMIQVASVALTFVFVAAGWVLFASTSFSGVITVMQRIAMGT
jgi:alginate O-acetyltransferase complex protein AlgI